MTHNQTRTSWWKEGIIGGVIGFHHAIVNVYTGDILNSLKRAIQHKQHKNLKSKFKKSPLNSYRHEIYYRIIQFSTFETAHSIYEPKNLKNRPHEKYALKKIPYMLGLDIRTVISGMISGIFKSLAEFRIVNGNYIYIFTYGKYISFQKYKWYNLVSLHNKLLPLMYKNGIMFGAVFSVIDTLRRNTTLSKTNLGIFMIAGIANTTGYIFTMPIEILNGIKSLRKSEFDNSNNNSNKNRSFILSNEAYSRVISKAIGNAGYNIPPLFIRSGFSMIVYQNSQILATVIGCRP